MSNIHPNGWRKLRARIVRLGTLADLGIAPRLGIAFASVAILAATANIIVKNGVSIVERVIYPNEPVLRDLPQGKPRAPSPDPARAVSSQLVVAWGNFDNAVRQHLDGRTRESAALYAAMRAELQTKVSAYLEQLPPAARNHWQAVQAAAKKHTESADMLIRVAHGQRTLLASYSAIFARMSARLQASIDGAWKIMGRVVARQSLLKLSAQLDDIQNSFAARGATGDSIEQPARAEQAFAATLQNSEAALRRSQGAEWLAGMRADFARLTELRVALAQAERRKTVLGQNFSRESERLDKTLMRIADAAAVEAARDAAPAAVTSETPPEFATTPATGTSRSHGALVAWVSGIVLAVLGYICVLTIVSVVRPVRRLLAATAKLGRGETPAPVARGGIRELDSLTHSFNVMAGQLAAAQAETRDTLQSLERKVHDRTSQLQELAERDSLTGLVNRRQLFVALNASIGHAAAEGTLVGAFFLDIDNFKTLNDSMGHAYGDRVLTAIARRLESTSRSFGFAARLGGDEFMIVHEGAQSIEEIVAAGTSVVEAFQWPIEVDGRELIVSVSVGASVYPDHEQNVEALLRAADAALFDAKAQGRSQLKVFTPELLLRASAKFAIEQNLRRAIVKGEFELFYQPEVSVQSLEVGMVEALIRWRMPDGSYRSPGEFLGVAEESGLIVEISDWVLRTAIATASEWYHGSWHAVRVAVNVSPRQFFDYRFVENLRKLLDEFRLPARCLEIELTESVLQTGPTTIHALGQLRAMGVAIALDDFGTGYSSMASLEQLPLTRIKLDRSLIARMDSNARSASIARGTIGLCNELGLEITAEGVERLEQFTALSGYRAMSLQGYLLARPVARGQVLEMLKRMPAHCQELLLLSQTSSAATATSDVLAPVAERSRA